MKRSIRALVRNRAGNRCEYCRVPQHAVVATFQIEHIIAQQHVLDDDDANLALACDRCNVIKGPNLSSIDPETGSLVRLFHPRRDHWDDHFAFHGPLVLGGTPIGRATVALLRMNDPYRIELRSLLLQSGETL